ncbi:cell division protein ZapC domain-containing protein [Neptunicella marina]|uniref:Cell division protein ZapC n=1 Tax=Neptunicella marina TaxID=2125989 RepID=A0A8J6IVL9_9ALTE|nr:cell division protein ZapC domain-containing protein [Neptunicella marina]MBC3767506.1 cell division protein ZapC [Neptunicella marina]
MMLQPSMYWCWVMDEDTQCLTLELEEGVYHTPYKSKHLLGHVSLPQEFTLEHLQCFTSVEEDIQQFAAGLTSELASQIAINAVAARFFHKPLAPKSWYFTKPRLHGMHHHFALLQCKREQLKVYIVEKEAQASVCMLISSQVALDESAQLKPFSLIKVMNDYLQPYLP